MPGTGSAGNQQATCLIALSDLYRRRVRQVRACCFHRGEEAVQCSLFVESHCRKDAFTTKLPDSSVIAPLHPIIVPAISDRFEHKRVIVVRLAIGLMESKTKELELEKIST
ncbi:hypothetical protein LJ655_01905 [Paraburkholderia sp. MMS20-SJTN17]|uniref:Uncharacterized protein n=1 Tax=Paraburkholderia translucens TaxID=2886945 RepID=A0ABS8K830_9BURK|nr:hypothetical protein [Paraburkholderia sp. MMS20-SJTN17]MCC8400658.1 hypothetical protein [Paraburkholderia sp. MMS20-SJTN17]